MPLPQQAGSRKHETGDSMRWASNHRSKHVKTNNNMHGRTRDNMQCRLLFPSRVLQMTAWRRYGTSKRESDQKPPVYLERVPLLPDNGRNFLSSTVRCESRPRAIRPQAARNIPVSSVPTRPTQSPSIASNSNWSPPSA